MNAKNQLLLAAIMGAIVPMCVVFATSFFELKPPKAKPAVFVKQPQVRLLPEEAEWLSGKIDFDTGTFVVRKWK